MATAMIGRDWSSRARKQAEGGFSLIEVMVSMVILTVGLVSLLGVFGLAMASTQTTSQDMIAKQLANEAYESIITARNTTQISWDDINNVGATNCPVSGALSCGIFMTGVNPIYLPATTGANPGIVGAANHGAEQTLEEPGPDGKYGDADDVILPLTGYQRTILISPLYAANGALVPSLRSITITVQYSTTQAKLPKTYILNSYISQYP
ncbi:MAG TPA: prepilin-type N-terminal cleavage/methylation domain-containing protein [Terriglobales bacterium]|nr:prepilin-type N-terminal cleavage/methylation domain-containing protein [Terriglobales bacterium]